MPDPDGPTEDVGETRDTDEEGRLDRDVVRDSTLDRGKDGTTSDTHDQETGGSSSVVTESGGTEHKDDGVHDGLETHDGDQADDTADTVERSDTDDHDEGSSGAAGEKDGSSNDR